LYVHPEERIEHLKEATVRKAREAREVPFLRKKTDENNSTGSKIAVRSNDGKALYLEGFSKTSPSARN